MLITGTELPNIDPALDENIGESAPAVKSNGYATNGHATNGHATNGHAPKDLQPALSPIPFLSWLR